MDKQDERSLKDKVKSALAVTVSAGIVLGGIFNPPAQAPEQKDRELPPPPTAIVEMVYPDLDDGDNGEVEEEEEEKKKKGGRFARFASWFRTLPRWAVPVIGATLWLLCQLVFSWLTAGFMATLPIWLASCIRWIFRAVLTLAVAAAVLKLKFPTLPFKEIFSKPRVLTAGIGTLLLVTADAALQLSGIPRPAAKAIGIAGGCILIAGLILSLKHDEKQKSAGEA